METQRRFVRMHLFEKPARLLDAGCGLGRRGAHGGVEVKTSQDVRHPLGEGESIFF